MSSISIEESYTKLVRPLSKKEYADLRLSIKIHGLLVPIAVNQNGIILDGHNRYQICQELGIKPVVIRKEFPSKTAEKLFVIESNLKRRHLTDIEKVELGMQLEPLEAELAKERAQTNFPEKGEQGFQPVSMLQSNDHNHTIPRHERTADAKTARKVGLSPKTYQRGKTVIEKGSDAIKEQVKAGKTSISAAYDQVKGKDKKPRQPKEATDILMLPADKFQATMDAIEEAIAIHDMQVVLRHNRHEVTGVGKEIEISTT